MRITKKQAAYHESMRKLTIEQKQRARQLYHAPPNGIRPSVAFLAKHFGVSRSTMFRVLNTTT